VCVAVWRERSGAIENSVAMYCNCLQCVAIVCSWLQWQCIVVCVLVFFLLEHTATECRGLQYTYTLAPQTREEEYIRTAMQCVTIRAAMSVVVFTTCVAVCCNTRKQ